MYIGSGNRQAMYIIVDRRSPENRITRPLQ